MPKEYINWSGYKWLTQERWGITHETKPYWWYDSSKVKVNILDTLSLETGYNPKYIEELDYTSPIGVGLISSTEKFGYGSYEIKAKLPYGDNLWPAFWMWSWDSWPPEIDIFEGYSDHNPDYFRFRLFRPWGFWNIQTNVHYKRKNKNKMLGGKTHWLGFKNPTQKFIKYKVVWEPNSIKFYYDDRLVRSIKDKKLLKSFEGHKMNVIINNGVTPKVDINNPPNSRFYIKYFKYKKL